ncbi:hypothetical protein [Nocardioides sp. P5_C9_2]
MADKDLEGDESSLELPSFGFGRKKRRPVASDAPVAPEPEPQPEPQPERQPEPEPDPEPLDRPTEVLEPVPAPQARPVRRPARRPEPVTTVQPAPVQPAPARERREVRLPTLPALPAVLLVGAVVGLTAVLLTYGSLRMCDVATGTASCGGGPGLLLMVAILIALTYLGGWLLRGFGIRDAASTSFLAVALLAVVAMLFLIDSLDEWSGAVAVTVVTILAYALSWKVTATLADAGEGQP